MRILNGRWRCLDQSGPVSRGSHAVLPALVARPCRRPAAELPGAEPDEVAAARGITRYNTGCTACRITPAGVAETDILQVTTITGKPINLYAVVYINVGLLGPLMVAAGGRISAIPGARPRILLSRLAVDVGRVVTVESLTQVLWPDERPRDPGHAVHSLVSRLRKALPQDSMLRCVPGGYLLCVPPDAVDTVRFERLAAAGRDALRNGNADAAARILREALGLWRGEALCDVAESPFAAPIRSRLEELRLAAVEDRIAADMGMPGDRGGLLPELRGLTAAYPLRERLRLLLVTALDADGRQAEALAAYEEFRALLAEELGAEPGPELWEAHLAVLRRRQPLPPRMACSRRASPHATRRPCRRMAARGDRRRTC